MANAITTIQKYLPLLDQVYAFASCSAILDTPNALVRETADAKTVLIAETSMSGLGDYSRADGFVSGDLTLYIWTPEAYAAADILTAENASQTVSMTICGQGNYWGQVSNIAAKCLDDTYYVAGVYTDESGNTYCTGVIAYSLSRYCMNNAKDGNVMQDLAAATAMYGYYAKTYFSSIG